MKRELVERALEEARSEEAKLVVWDWRDTFTIEPKADVSLEDEYARVELEDGKSVIYVEYEYVYKVAIEREKSAARKGGPRAGFGSREED